MLAGAAGARAGQAGRLLWWGPSPTCRFLPVSGPYTGDNARKNGSGNATRQAGAHVSRHRTGWRRMTGWRNAAGWRTMPGRLADHAAGVRLARWRQIAGWRRLARGQRRTVTLAGEPATPRPTPSK
jgi:hypothetical protein